MTDPGVHDADPGVHDADPSVHDADPGVHDGPFFAPSRGPASAPADPSLRLRHLERERIRHQQRKMAVQRRLLPQHERSTLLVLVAHRHRASSASDSAVWPVSSRCVRPDAYPTSDAAELATVVPEPAPLSAVDSLGGGRGRARPAPAGRPGQAARAAMITRPRPRGSGRARPNPCCISTPPHQHNFQLILALTRRSRDAIAAPKRRPATSLQRMSREVSPAVRAA